MHRLFITALALCMAIFIANSALAATSGPEQLKLAPPAGMKATKTPVDFPHGKHVALPLDCVSCHHTWDGKSEISSCAAPGCHVETGKKGPEAFYTAFHAKKTETSCLGCHKIVKKRDGKPVPVSCKSCHPK